MSKSYDISEIVNSLEYIDSQSIQAEHINHFLEIVHNSEPSELCICGNTEGLVHLAKWILKIADSKIDGKHVHFDNTGIVDRCDVPLIISFKKAPW